MVSTHINYDAIQLSDIEQIRISGQWPFEWRTCRRRYATAGAECASLPLALGGMISRIAMRFLDGCGHHADLGDASARLVVGYDIVRRQSDMAVLRQDGGLFLWTLVEPDSYLPEMEEVNAARAAFRLVVEGMVPCVRMIDIADTRLYPRKIV